VKIIFGSWSIAGCFQTPYLVLLGDVWLLRGIWLDYSVAVLLNGFLLLVNGLAVGEGGFGTADFLHAKFQGFWCGKRALGGVGQTFQTEVAETVAIDDLVVIKDCFIAGDAESFQKRWHQLSLDLPYSFSG